MKSLKPEEVFEYIPEKYKYIAMRISYDKHRHPKQQWKAFVEKPAWVKSEGESFKKWLGFGIGPGANSILILNIDYDGTPEDSLFERPARAMNV